VDRRDGRREKKRRKERRGERRIRCEQVKDGNGTDSMVERIS